MTGFTLCDDIMEIVGKEVNFQRHKKKYNNVLESIININYEGWEGNRETNWDWCYGSDLCKPDATYPLDFVMAGGGAHAWNYVIKEDGLYIWKYGEGTTKQNNKILVSDPSGNRVQMFDKDYELRDGETDLYELCQELDIAPQIDSDTEEETDDEDDCDY